jgi:predicted secreted protein
MILLMADPRSCRRHLQTALETKRIKMKRNPLVSTRVARSVRLPGLTGLAALALAVLPAQAQAQVQAQPPGPASAVPQNVLDLGATASQDVPQDWLTVVFSTTREARDAATVQAQLKQAIQPALALARQGAQPGQLEVHSGGFSLFPRYAPPSSSPSSSNSQVAAGTLNGWQGSAELVVEGRDTQAIAELAGHIGTLSIASLGFSLSREAREQVEAEVTRQAIDRFRARAAAVSRQFGFEGYTVRELTLSSDVPGPMPAPMMRAMSVAAAPRDEPLPVQAGKATVSVTVSGSVQMH